MKLKVTTTPTNISVKGQHTNLEVSAHHSKLTLGIKQTNLVVAGPEERTVMTIKAIGPAGPRGPHGPGFDPTTDFTLYYKLAKG